MLCRVVAIESATCRCKPQHASAVFKDRVYVVVANGISVSVLMLQLRKLSGREVVAEHTLSVDRNPEPSLLVELQIGYHLDEASQLIVFK